MSEPVWMPLAPAVPLVLVPTPENGKWLKAEGGAAIWKDPVFDADSGWHDVTFVLGFENYGSGFPPVRYRKLSDGTVAFTGLMKNSNWNAVPINTNHFCFTGLPVGYRPSAESHRITVAMDNTCKVVLRPAGDVYVNYKAAGWVSFDSVRFPLV